VPQQLADGLFLLPSPFRSATDTGCALICTEPTKRQESTRNGIENSLLLILPKTTALSGVAGGRAEQNFHLL
jgi:hypothetical protein